MVSLCNNAPYSLRMTTLHPVLNPGSRARTRFCPIGAANRSWRRFSANTFIATSSAFSLYKARISVSNDGSNRRFHASSMASCTKSVDALSALMKILSNVLRASSSLILSFTLRSPSASARNIAKIRWLGASAIDSFQSKYC